MGTYHDSKIVTARREHFCHHCTDMIGKGQTYLRFLIGQRNTWCIHLECVARNTKRYDCAAVRENIKPIFGTILDQD